MGLCASKLHGSPPTPAAVTPGLAAEDYSREIPDECLELVFQSLSPGDRKRCSLVCRRWLAVDGGSRHRLSLDARASLADAAPAIFARFGAVTKLALKCDRRADSIDDAALAAIAAACPGLTRLKLRACRELTEAGMAALALRCASLRKLSCGSCAFGSKGVEAVLAGCPSLEELSLKRLRGLTNSSLDSSIAPASLRSIYLKELYNGQCFTQLILNSRNLTTLKLLRCSGDWDPLLEDIPTKLPNLAEVHFEKLQVSDRGLSSLSGCSQLQVLHLVKTPECTDIGLTAVAKRCRMLRRVHIDGWKTNRIGDEGLSAIALRCPNIQELVLIGLNPTAASLELIAGNCKSLERLALCGSETFGDAEMCCIAAKCNALKKLCIKGCPVSDQGMEALVEGCPNLVKVKVKKCKNVTSDCADWLRTARGSLAVNMDAAGPIELQDGSICGSGVLENGIDQVQGLMGHITALDLLSNRAGQSTIGRARMGLLASRNFVKTTFRRWSSFNGNSNNSYAT